MTTGAFTRVGNGGYSWASTVSGVSAYYMDFYSGRIYPSSAFYRAYGFQVRCLREWQPVGRKRNKGAGRRPA